MTGPESINGGQQPVNQKLLKETGVKFEKNSLKSLEEISIHTYKDGAQVRKRDVKATLSNGTAVQFPIPQKDAKIVQNGEDQYDFDKLNNAEIMDTDMSDTYNLMGCKFTDVKANKGYDSVKIDNHKDGTKHERNTVFGANAVDGIRKT